MTGANTEWVNMRKKLMGVIIHTKWVMRVGVQVSVMIYQLDGGWMSWGLPTTNRISVSNIGGGYGSVSWIGIDD